MSKVINILYLGISKKKLKIQIPEKFSVIILKVEQFDSVTE